MTRSDFDALGLAGGSWQSRHGVQVWVAEVRRPLEPPPPLIALLIACPFCRAKVNQTCRTPAGNPRTPHVVRLAPRLCECGSRLARKKLRCPPCAVEARRRTYRLREMRQPTRGRRRAAKFKACGRCWIPLDTYRSLCGLVIADCAEHAAERLGLEVVA